MSRYNYNGVDIYTPVLLYGDVSSNGAKILTEDWSNFEDIIIKCKEGTGVGTTGLSQIILSTRLITIGDSYRLATPTTAFSITFNGTNVITIANTLDDERILGIYGRVRR